MKTAIVTGATGNLGKAVTENLLAGGYDVWGTVTRSSPGLFDAHPGFHESVIDLTDEAAAGLLVTDIISQQQAIEVAVLTVGGFVMGKINETGSADIRKQYQLNFETAYHIARPVFLAMLDKGYGRIFLTGSIPGSDLHHAKGVVAYSLSKSLLFGLAEILNDEAKGTNVVTAVVVPGTIDTPQNHSAMPGADTSTWIRPETIAKVIAFYAGPDALQIREAVIRITGA